MQQWIIKELLLQDIAFVNGSDRILPRKSDRIEVKHRYTRR
jgi:hypothetical protein